MRVSPHSGAFLLEKKMGIQAIVSVKDLLDKGLSVLMEHETFYDEDGCVQYTEYLAKATFPCGAEFWFHSVPEDGTVWTDFNYWGNNRPKLLPLLERYGIPYKEV